MTSNFSAVIFGQTAYQEPSGVFFILSLVWFVVAISMNGRVRPDVMTGPQRAPSKSRAPAMRVSLSMRVAEVAPPREWPKAPAWVVLRHALQLGMIEDAKVGEENWVRM